MTLKRKKSIIVVICSLFVFLSCFFYFVSKKIDTNNSVFHKSQEDVIEDWKPPVVKDEDCNVVDSSFDSTSFYGVKSVIEVDSEGYTSLKISESFDNNEWLNESAERVEVARILPDGVMLLDLESVPQTNKYLGVYVKDYEVKESKTLEVFPDGDVLITCPDQNYGQTYITAEYHLFVYGNGEVLDDKIIPNSYWSGLDYGNQRQEFSLINTRVNNFYLGGGEDGENIKDKNRLERTKLIQLSDRTGDNLAWEFVINGHYLSCGHSEKLVAGLSSDEKRAVIYQIKNSNAGEDDFDSGEYVYWHDNFSPNNLGEVEYVFACGDHGADVEIKKNFKFDEKNNNFELISSLNEECVK